MIEEWQGFIQKRTNGSERVNYDDPNFPSYVFRGYVYPSSTWANDPHYHDDVELLTVTNGYLSYSINSKEIPVEDSRMARSFPGSLWRVTVKGAPAAETDRTFTVRKRDSDA